jgi:anti-sigma factor RsiW
VILTLFGVLLWTMVFPRSRNENLLAQEVVSSHIRSMMLNHLVDVPSSDQHTVKPWFNGKLDFAPDVKDFADQGFPLVGGRLDYIDNRTVAALIYQRRKHAINLFIWPAPEVNNQPAQQLSVNGYNIIHWTRSGTRYWAVSDVNSADLSEFAKLVSQ